eukprot:1983855-Rhodomonas_salina.1
MVTPGCDVIELLFRYNLWHLPLWTSAKEAKACADKHSMAATLPSLANNPYASLLDLRDNSEPQSLISGHTLISKSKRRGQHFRKVVFQQSGSSAAESRVMTAVRHDVTDGMMSCPSLICPTTLLSVSYTHLRAHETEADL